jgi:serine/threonine-protein phosphatase PPG1
MFEILTRLCRGEVLPERTVKQLCDKLKEHLIYESNVLSLSSPLTIVGDIHGCAPPVLFLYYYYYYYLF